MYETLQVMRYVWYLPYQLVNAGFLNHQPYFWGRSSKKSYWNFSSSWESNPFNCLRAFQPSTTISLVPSQRLVWMMTVVVASVAYSSFILNSAKTSTACVDDSTCQLAERHKTHMKSRRFPWFLHGCVFFRNAKTAESSGSGCVFTYITNVWWKFVCVYVLMVHCTCLMEQKQFKKNTYLKPPTLDPLVFVGCLIDLIETHGHGLFQLPLFEDEEKAQLHIHLHRPDPKISQAAQGNSTPRNLRPWALEVDNQWNHPRSLHRIQRTYLNSNTHIQLFLLWDIRNISHQCFPCLFSKVLDFGL